MYRTDSALKFLLFFPNVNLVTPYYRWQLIKNDPDDNKFVDCAVATNADYIVSNDSDFRHLKNITFPKVNVITIEQFENIIFN